MDNKIIRGVWVGDHLSNIQKLCIKSFLDNGHDFHLYIYENFVDGIPEGCTVINGNEILPWGNRDRFISNNHFSDYFRSVVTYQLGGFYTDMDIVCLKPFDFSEERVFVSEFQFNGTNPRNTEPKINGCILKVPQNDPMTKEIIERIDAMDTRNPDLDWISVGPAQYRKAVPEFNHEKFIKHPDVFDSLWPEHLINFTSSNGTWRPAENAYGIHLRTSYWKPGSLLEPDGKYYENSYFEILKRKHDVK